MLYNSNDDDNDDDELLVECEFDELLCRLTPGVFVDCVTRSSELLTFSISCYNQIALEKISTNFDFSDDITVSRLTQVFKEL